MAVRNDPREDHISISGSREQVKKAKGIVEEMLLKIRESRSR